MAQNKVFNSQPAYLATATLSSLGCNLFNTAITSLTPTAIGWGATQPYALMKHIRILNQLTTAAVTVTLYKGLQTSATAGTQFAFPAFSLPPQTYQDWVGLERFDSGDWLVGIASLQQAIIINMEGEVGLS